MSDIMESIILNSVIQLPRIDPDDLVVPETPIYGLLVDYNTGTKIRNATKADYNQFIKSTTMCQLYWYPPEMNGLAVSIVRGRI